jgi:hypothetical protein
MSRGCCLGGLQAAIGGRLGQLDRADLEPLGADQGAAHVRVAGPVGPAVVEVLAGGLDQGLADSIRPAQPNNRCATICGMELAVLRQVVDQAVAEAVRTGSDEVEVDHLLFALRLGDGTVAQRLRSVPTAELTEPNRTVRAIPDERRRGHPLLSQPVRRVVRFAVGEADRRRHDELRPEHLLLGVLHEGPGRLSRGLAEQGVSVDDVESWLTEWRRTRT